MNEHLFDNPVFDTDAFDEEEDKQGTLFDITPSKQEHHDWMVIRDFLPLYRLGVNRKDVVVRSSGGSVH